MPKNGLPDQSLSGDETPWKLPRGLDRCDRCGEFVQEGRLLVDPVDTSKAICEKCNAACVAADELELDTASPPNLPPLVYPHRQSFELDEIERQNIQLEHVRRIMGILAKHREDYNQRALSGDEYWKGRRDEAGWAYDRLKEFMERE